MGERRVTGATVQRLLEDLSARDRAIVEDVTRVRVLTSQQIGRLHFAELTGVHRDRTRRRVLERLVEQQLLATLDRRIGGVRAGSAGLVFAIGIAGQKLLALEAMQNQDRRARYPGTPTERFLAHNLVVAELYVSLTESARANALTLNTFHAEPACWWRDSEGEWIKPDAHVIVSNGDIEDSWAIEVDQATESLPTLRRKLMTYVSLANNEERGPNRGPLPRVLVTVPHAARRMAVAGVIAMLPPPAQDLIAVTVHSGAIDKISRVLRE